MVFDILKNLSESPEVLKEETKDLVRSKKRRTNMKTQKINMKKKKAMKAKNMKSKEVKKRTIKMKKKKKKKKKRAQLNKESPFFLLMSILVKEKPRESWFMKVIDLTNLPKDSLMNMVIHEIKSLNNKPLLF